jgi:hypothetical protein
VLLLVLVELAMDVVAEDEVAEDDEPAGHVWTAPPGGVYGLPPLFGTPPVP